MVEEGRMRWERGKVSAYDPQQVLIFRSEGKLMSDLHNRKHAKSRKIKMTLMTDHIKPCHLMLY